MSFFDIFSDRRGSKITFCFFLLSLLLEGDAIFLFLFFFPFFFFFLGAGEGIWLCGRRKTDLCSLPGLGYSLRFSKNLQTEKVGVKYACKGKQICSSPNHLFRSMGDTETEFKPQHLCALAASCETAPSTMHAFFQFLEKHYKVPGLFERSIVSEHENSSLIS